MAKELMADDDQYVVFKLGRETYGLEISTVLEIITMQAITEVPGTESFVEGVINLRGLVIPVFNLYKKFNIEEAEQTKTTRIVVVEVNGSSIGMMVDEVSEVVKINKELVEPPSSLIGGIGEEYLTGVAKLDGRLVVLLDLAKVLHKDEANVLDGIG